MQLLKDKIRPIRWVIPFLILFTMLACGIEVKPGLLSQSILKNATLQPEATFTSVQPSPTETRPVPTATASETPTATNTPVPPTATNTQTPTPSATPTQDLSAPFLLHWHPDGPLYVGDTASLEVVPVIGQDVAGKTVEVQLINDNGARPLGSARFDTFGLGGRMQATFWWFWNTAGLEPGKHTLSFSVKPDGPTWQQTVELLPKADLPAEYANARWLSADSQCCTLYYMSGTAAERDIEKLKAMADQQAADDSKKLGAQLDQKIPVVLLPRVLGHSGFTAEEIAISYLDRNYAGNATDLVLHHEIVHWLDGKLGGDLRPTLFVEGLAVYLTGGHFKQEPLMPRAAALLPAQDGCVPVSASVQVSPTGTVVPTNSPNSTGTPDKPACGLGSYIPLAQLADNFYPSQHETGYLEGAALIEYMVKTYGWQAFSDFYRDIHPYQQPTAAPGSGPTATPAPPPTQSAAIDAALRKHFNLSFADLEKNFIAALREVPLTPDLVNDVSLSVEFFNSMRHYQKLLDPSAYYLYAWLADTQEMRKRGLVADLLRHPDAVENQTLEVMFVRADELLRAGNYDDLAALLKSINTVLDAIEAGNNSPFDSDPTAADYYALVQVLNKAGYEPQHVELNGDKAQISATASGVNLLELGMQRGPQGWVITQLPKVFAWGMPIETQSLLMDIHTAN